MRDSHLFEVEVIAPGDLFGIGISLEGEDQVADVVVFILSDLVFVLDMCYLARAYQQLCRSEVVLNCVDGTVSGSDLVCVFTVWDDVRIDTSSIKL